LLEQPLDPRVARAVVALGCVVLVGFSGAVALGVSAGGPGSSTSAARPAPPVAVALHRDPEPANLPAPVRSLRDPSPRRQDPQDEPGSSAAARAERELSNHRALQHVPYRHDGVTIALVGASSSYAVLKVEGPSIPTARRAWRAFLRCYRDDGDAYLPRFRSRAAFARGAAHPAPYAAADPAARSPASKAAIPHRGADRRDPDLPTSPHHLKVGP
jgi:hypothetical protein